jgi:hypothetical protein
VKSITKYFHCGDQLLSTLAGEIGDVEAAAEGVPWMASFAHSDGGARREHQTAYNLAFAGEFGRMGWESQPMLRRDPRLIGDFRKGLVFVEIQFGNSAALYRDYYKFQYGSPTACSPLPC